MAESSGMVNVSLAEHADADAWRTYVRAHPSATVFHLPEWSDAVARAYGHRPLHAVARAEGRLVGVLPLFEVRSVFVGRVLVSVPYATYGGILADDREATLTLAEFAEQLCARRRARYLELRHREPVGLDLPVIDLYDTFRKELPETAEDVLAALPRKTRTAVRKGLKEIGPDAVTIGPDGLDEVYDLYASTLRRLGSPNYRKSFFFALREAYGDDCIVLLVRDQGVPVAGVVSFVFREEIVPYFSGSLDTGMAKRANNLMYFKLMEYAVERGLRRFDFNRTRRDNRGPYDFKRHHGFEPSPLAYQIWLGPGGTMPNLTPSNRKFALAGRLWRHLPLWLTRPAGERITRWIP